ncbi:RHS repeat-associated core domain-containing protein [Streptomyces mirabilis]|uniref:RHS repeat-associated core domain-containing protein n=1 Tax=Streptomyces TaxID=1883 RepID=UPI0033BFB1B1
MAARWLYSPLRSISTSTNLYDADGSLLLRHSPDTTTLFAGDEEITLKRDATSADGVRYISLAGETVATYSSDGHFTYLTPDRQGTGTLAIDSQTQQVTRRQYKPFGETRDQSGTWTGGQRGYTGGTQDDNTGLTNLGAREYAPSIGRFLNPDPRWAPASRSPGTPTATPTTPRSPAPIRPVPARTSTARLATAPAASTGRPPTPRQTPSVIRPT